MEVRITVKGQLKPWVGWRWYSPWENTYPGRKERLAQWFSVRGDFVSRSYLEMSRDIFSHHNWGGMCSWHLVGRG